MAHTRTLTAQSLTVPIGFYAELKASRPLRLHFCACIRSPRLKVTRRCPEFQNMRSAALTKEATRARSCTGSHSA